LNGNKGGLRIVIEIAFDDREEGKSMLKLATLMFASALLFASGCAEHDQRVALQQKCNSGNQNACRQIAQDTAAFYPEPPNVRVFPSGQRVLGNL
jgi:hypothetical protein